MPEANEVNEKDLIKKRFLIKKCRVGGDSCHSLFDLFSNSFLTQLHRTLSLSVENSSLENVKIIDYYAHD
jgi:hypothetical protein